MEEPFTGRSRIYQHLQNSMQASLLQTEVKLTVTFIIMTTYFTGIVKCGLVLQQIQFQLFVLISKSKEIKLIFSKVKL